MSAQASSLDLDLGRWTGPVTDADRSVLQRAEGPVLDIGCGPGRHVRALALEGVLALGLDASPQAVRIARAHGAHVIQGSVFGTVPGVGTWRSALLLDGNIGIGGAPVRLLERVRTLLAEGGRVLVEVGAPGTRGQVLRARVRGCAVEFPWTAVGDDRLDGIARAAGFAVLDRWREDERWFAELR